MSTSKRDWLSWAAPWLLLLVPVAACSSESPSQSQPPAGTGGGGTGGSTNNPAGCTPAAATEMTCSDGRDDDCDGRIDCMDTDCEGKSCGGAGMACTAGACIAPDIFPKLSAIGNVH